MANLIGYRPRLMNKSLLVQIPHLSSLVWHVKIKNKIKNQMNPIDEPITKSSWKKQKTWQ